jgi:hypothetical protein
MAYSDGRNYFAEGYFATGYWHPNYWSSITEVIINTSKGINSLFMTLLQ